VKSKLAFIESESAIEWNGFVVEEGKLLVEVFKKTILNVRK
jgi:hypothetical protein